MPTYESSTNELSPKELAQTKERFKQDELRLGVKLGDIIQTEAEMDPSAWTKINRIQQRAALATAQKASEEYFGKPTISGLELGAAVGAKVGNVADKAGCGLATNPDADPGRGDIILRRSGRGYIEINAGPGCGDGPTVKDTDLKNDQSRVNELARPDVDNSDRSADAKNGRLHLNENADPTRDCSNKTKDVKNDHSRVNDNIDPTNDQTRVQNLGEPSKIGY